MKLRFYELEGDEPEILLRALLSGLKPDGVRLIIRNAINVKIAEYKEAGAAFLVHFNPDASEIRVICVNHGELQYPDMYKLDVLEDLYNTIDEGGIE